LFIVQQAAIFVNKQCSADMPEEVAAEIFRNFNIFFVDLWILYRYKDNEKLTESLPLCRF